MPLWLTLYKNSAWREGIGIDFCIGQFDTTAWRSSTDRQRCNNWAFISGPAGVGVLQKEVSI
jgi:hypothetical protein